MQDDISRDQITTRFKEEWLPELREKLSAMLSEEIQGNREIIETTLDLMESGGQQKALQYLAEKWSPKDRSEETEQNSRAEIVPEWLEIINVVSGKIPEKLVFIQQEQRFILSENDSLSIKSGKWLKRFGRAVKNGATAWGNIFRKLSGKPVKEKPEWYQSVPIMNLATFHMLEWGNWVDDYSNSLHRIKAELLLKVDASILANSGLLPAKVEQDDNGSAQKNTAKYQTDEGLTQILRESFEELQKLEKHYSEGLEKYTQEILRNIEKDLLLAGTIELRASKFDDGEVRQKRRMISQSQQINNKRWLELTAQLSNRILVSTRFIGLHTQAEELISGFADAIKEFFNTTLDEPLNLISEELKVTIAAFKKSEHTTVKEIKKLGAQHRESLSENIEKQLLKPLREITNDAVLSSRLERFTSALPEWANEQPEKAVLVEEIDLSKVPPSYEIEQVNWQVLVRRVINNQLAKELMPKEVKFEQFLEEVIGDIKEFFQIIYTNLEIVDEVKKSDEEEPFEVARQGLERARVQLDEILDAVQAKKDTLLSALRDNTKAVFSTLAKLLNEQDVGDLRIAGAEYKAKEAAVNWNTKLQAKWARFLEKGELLGRFMWKKVKLYDSNTRKFLGFVKEEKFERATTDLATFLSETDKKIESLPFIYRRLFDFKKEVDERFYIRRHEQFDHLKKGYELWQNEFPSTFAVVGEKGSGKSLFLRLMMDEVVTKHDVIDINFQETVWHPEQIVERISSALNLDDISTTVELIEAIGRKKKRTVVILENIQNCYIRNLAGFEALEQLLYLISETNKEILWVASSTRYGWVYLDKVLNVVDYFTHVIQSDQLTAEQIEELIIKRHRASGYQLIFLPDEAASKSRSYRKLMDDEKKKQEYLKKEFFGKLSALAEGNPSIAMIYWIRSIKEFDDTHFYINPFQFGKVNRISELESQELFTLAAFIMHDELNPEELHKIMHQPLRESKLMVSRLTSRSILLKTEYGYILNHLIYRQVVRVLKEANILH